jgi:hypothetical protein
MVEMLRKNPPDGRYATGWQAPTLPCFALVYLFFTTGATPKSAFPKLRRLSGEHAFLGDCRSTAIPSLDSASTNRFSFLATGGDFHDIESEPLAFVNVAGNRFRPLRQQLLDEATGGNQDVMGVAEVKQFLHRLRGIKLNDPAANLSTSRMRPSFLEHPAGNVSPSVYNRAREFPSRRVNAAWLGGH